MFSNIGGKIKVLAQVLTWLGIASSVVIGFIIMAEGDDEEMIVGFIVMVLGSLLSWITSFILYGFGELVENSTRVADVVAGPKYNNAQYQQNNYAQSNNYAQPMNGAVQYTNNAYQERIATLNKWRADGLITEQEYQFEISKLRGN